MNFLIEPLSMTSLFVTGSDRRTWLDSLLTAELKELSASRGVPALLLTKQGKIQAELAVFEAEMGVEIAQSGGARTLDDLNRYLIMEDAEIEARPEASWFALFGDFGSGPGPELPGVVLEYAPMGRRGRLYRTLAPATEALHAAASQGGVRDEARFAAERIEIGYPLPVVDYGSEDNPHEASLEETHVSFKKGCYLGQEVVCMQEMRGKVKRRLVRLESEGIVLPGQIVLDDTGQEVGKVTSASGHRALAKVKAPHYMPGTRLSLGGVSASVRALRPGIPWAQADSAGTLSA